MTARCVHNFMIESDMYEALKASCSSWVSVCLEKLPVWRTLFWRCCSFVR